MRYEVFDCNCKHLGCINGWNNGRLRVLLIYGLDELKVQIGNVAYAQADSASRVNGYGKEIISERMMKQFIDVVQEGNIEWVKNTIALAVSRIEHILYDWTCQTLKNNISFDNFPKPDKLEYLIELKVPKEFSDTTAVYVMNLAQRFIVATVLEEWASLTYPDGMAAWSNMVQTAASELEKAFRINNTPAFIKPCWC